MEQMKWQIVGQDMLKKRFCSVLFLLVVRCCCDQVYD